MRKHPWSPEVRVSGERQRVPRGGGGARSWELCWWRDLQVASPSLPWTCSQSYFLLSDSFAREMGLVHPQVLVGARVGDEDAAGGAGQPLWTETGASSWIWDAPHD